MFPGVERPPIWRHITRGSIRATCHCVFHDVIPAQMRYFFRIRRQPAPDCPQRAVLDTLQHRRLTGRRVTSDIWQCRRRRLAIFMRTDPRYVPGAWLTTPNVNTRLRQEHDAVLWIMGHVTRATLSPTLLDYSHFLRRPRRRTCQWTKRFATSGNYLDCAHKRPHSHVGGNVTHRASV